MVELYMADHGEFPTMEDYDYKEASNSDVHSLTAKSRHNTEHTWVVGVAASPLLIHHNVTYDIAVYGPPFK